MISLLAPIYITCSRVIAQSYFVYNTIGIFKERGKPEYPEKNLSGRGREPTTNSTHMWRPRQDSNRGCIGGRRVLSPLRHPCSPEATKNHLHTPLSSTGTCQVFKNTWQLMQWSDPRLAALTYFAVAVKLLHWILFGETNSAHYFDALGGCQGCHLFSAQWKEEKTNAITTLFIHQKQNTQSVSSFILNENI